MDGAVVADAGAPTRTWLDGTEVATDERAWSVRSAEFLGCGFRVAVPRGGGTAALADARARVQVLADLLDARVDPVPWQVASEAVRDGSPWLLEGGWESVFRGPPGPPMTRLRTGRAPGPSSTTAAVELPWTVATGSDLSRLPVISTHEHRAALRHLAASWPASSPTSPTGLWRAPDGRLVRTTAGSALAWDGQGWLHPVPGPGVVGSWLAERLQELLGSTADPLLPGPSRALFAVDAWGTVTTLLVPPTSAAREQLGAALARLLRA